MKMWRFLLLLMFLLNTIRSGNSYVSKFFKPSIKVIGTRSISSSFSASSISKASITKTLLSVNNYRSNRNQLGSLRMVSGGSGNGGGGMENPMNPQLYTEKAWDAVSKVPQYADKYSNQMVEATHLLRALFDEGGEGLTQRILQKADFDKKILDNKLDEFMSKQPRVSNVSQKSIGRSLEQTLIKAGSLKKEMGDSFISIEHLILAMAQTDPTQKIFKDSGIALNKLQVAVEEAKRRSEASESGMHSSIPGRH